MIIDAFHSQMVLNARYTVDMLAALDQEENQPTGALKKHFIHASGELVSNLMLFLYRFMAYTPKKIQIRKLLEVKYLLPPMLWGTG